MSQQEGTKEVSDREGQKISTSFEFGDAVKSHQHERVSKKDRVVEESLGRHQHEPEKRTSSMLMRDRVPNFTPRRVRPRVDSGWRRSMRRQVFRATKDSLFHLVDDLLGFGISPVNHQPARAFGNPTAKEKHDQAQSCANPKDE